VGLYGFVTKTLVLTLRKRLHKTYQNFQWAEKSVLFQYFLMDRSGAGLQTLQFPVGASLLAKAGYQKSIRKLTQRIREQARSHSFGSLHRLCLRAETLIPDPSSIKVLTPFNPCPIAGRLLALSPINGFVMTVAVLIRVWNKQALHAFKEEIGHDKE
jgi:hypothetical protein